MKIAVINPFLNPGGGVRYEKALLLALKKNFVDVEIDYYGNVERLEKEHVRELYKENGIRCISFLLHKQIKKSKKRFFLKRILRLVKMLRYNYKYTATIQKINNNYDIAFFPWPYGFFCPEITIPMVCVPHDMNFRYFFGQRIFKVEEVRKNNNNLRLFFKKSTVVVSSNFMAMEIKRFYREYVRDIFVVHLAPFSFLSKFEENKVNKVLEKFSINYKYIIAPTNTTYHKNVGMLIAAFSLIRERRSDVKLIITGPGTDNILGKSTYFGIEEATKDWDTIGLGYLENDEIDVLIKKSEVVVNCSLYEAGNGSGLDAWGYGVPVAMSDIPAFTEHLEVLGVHAEVFDPRNAHDMAQKIGKILLNSSEYKKYSKESEINIHNNISWDTVAREYYKIFYDTIKNGA
jgi:glycosyltransferase involved in cell wall biosynthesis